MRIIDFHVHIYPDGISERAMEGIRQFYGIQSQCAGTVSDLLHLQKAAGVTYSVVNSVATAPKQVGSINRFLFETCTAHPECIGLGALHPDMTDAELDMALMQIKQYGLRGVKLHPDFQKTAVDSPEMARIFARLEGKLPVLVHCGDYRSDLSHPRRLAKVLDAFPKLTVIAAHFGGWPIFDYALEYLPSRNCYLDLSSSIMYTGPRRAKELIRFYGADRILYGTDYPMWEPKEQLNAFLALSLTEKENEKILYANAAKILGRES